MPGKDTPDTFGLLLLWRLLGNRMGARRRPESGPRFGPQQALEDAAHRWLTTFAGPLCTASLSNFPEKQASTGRKWTKNVGMPSISPTHKGRVPANRGKPRNPEPGGFRSQPKLATPTPTGGRGGSIPSPFGSRGGGSGNPPWEPPKNEIWCFVTDFFRIFLYRGRGCSPTHPPPPRGRGFGCKTLQSN